jgi:hypothetical protein
MEAARTSETSVDNHFTRQYNPEDSSEHHTRRRENLKSHFQKNSIVWMLPVFTGPGKQSSTVIIILCYIVQWCNNL